MSFKNKRIEVPANVSPGRKIRIDPKTLRALYGVDDEEKMYNRMRDIALYAEDDKDAISAIDKIWDRVYGKPKQSLDIDSNVSMDAGIFIGDLKDQEEDKEDKEE